MIKNKFDSTLLYKQKYCLFFGSTSHLLGALVRIINDIEISYLSIMSDEYSFDSILVDGRPYIKKPKLACEVRQIWHIASYVNFLCQFHGTADNIYSKYRTHIEANANINLKNNAHVARGIIGIIKKYRNKVFAHAAYYQFQSNDTPATQRRSLAILSGLNQSMGDGRVSVSLPDTPSIDMFICAKIAENLASQWATNFREIHEVLDSLPESEISCIFGGTQEEKMKKVLNSPLETQLPFIQ